MDFYNQIKKKSNSPLIMGILNITPDSFYDGGKYTIIHKIIDRVKTMIYEGVDIIDIGAASSRPGSKSISIKEEEKRLFPILIKIRELFPNITISIDTYRHQIAEQAIKYGANIINDIYVSYNQEKMFSVIKKYNVTYILMHMSGKPSNMQKNINYNNFNQEIIRFFEENIKKLKHHQFEQIIIDPGFGFGKTINQNYELINMIPELAKFGYPVLAGLSRKSMISHSLNINTEQSLNGTIAANTICLTKGVDIIRVHDIQAARETIDIFNLTNKNLCN